MAQPAWVVRARRAQIRRQLAATRRIARREAQRTILAAQRSQLRYISQTLQLGRQGTMAARAAIAARSVLENRPSTPFAAPQSAIDTPPGLAWMDRLLAFSPRVAAHAIVISLVMTAAL